MTVTCALTVAGVRDQLASFAHRRIDELDDAYDRLSLERLELMLLTRALADAPDDLPVRQVSDPLLALRAIARDARHAAAADTLPR